MHSSEARAERRAFKGAAEQLRSSDLFLSGLWSLKRSEAFKRALKGSAAARFVASSAQSRGCFPAISAAAAADCGPEAAWDRVCNL